jgi:hypothetical protein
MWALAGLWRQGCGDVEALLAQRAASRSSQHSSNRGRRRSPAAALRGHALHPECLQRRRGSRRRPRRQSGQSAGAPRLPSGGPRPPALRLPPRPRAPPQSCTRPHSNSSPWASAGPVQPLASGGTTPAGAVAVGMKPPFLLPSPHSPRSKPLPSRSKDMWVTQSGEKSQVKPAKARWGGAAGRGSAGPRGAARCERAPPWGAGGAAGRGQRQREGGRKLEPQPRARGPQAARAPTGAVPGRLGRRVRGRAGAPRPWPIGLRARQRASAAPSTRALAGAGGVAAAPPGLPGRRAAHSQSPAAAGARRRDVRRHLSTRHYCSAQAAG